MTNALVLLGACLLFVLTLTAHDGLGLLFGLVWAGVLVLAWAYRRQVGLW